MQLTKDTLKSSRLNRYEHQNRQTGKGRRSSRFLAIVLVSLLRPQKMSSALIPSFDYRQNLVASVGCKHGRVGRILRQCSQPFFFSSSTPKESDGSEDTPRNVEAMAVELRQRARTLKEEACILEFELKKSKESDKQKRTVDVQSYIDKLFLNDRPLTIEAVTRILREERFTEEQTILVMHELYRRQADSVNDVVGMYRNGTSVAEFWESGKGQFNLTNTCMKLLLDASIALDKECSGLSSASTNRRWSGRVAPQLKSRLIDWTRNDELNAKRLLASNLQVNTTTESTIKRVFFSSTENIKTLPASKNVSSLAVESSNFLVPPWIPEGLVSHVIRSSSQLDPVDVRAVKEHVLSRTLFFCTSSESVEEAAIFRGNIRQTPSPTSGIDTAKTTAEKREFSATVFRDIQRQLAVSGLSEKIQLFLLPDPEWKPNRHEGAGELKPVLLALPVQVTPDETKIRKSVVTKAVQKLSSIGAVAAAMLYSVGCYALNPVFFDSIVNQHSLTMMKACLPIFCGVLGVQAVHELAHFVVAKRRDIKIGLPLLLPSARLGTLGCITPIRSFPDNRSALLDFSLSGPVAAALLSVCFMIIGCLNTVGASQSLLSKFPIVPLATLKSSFLSGTVLSFLLPKAMALPTSQSIPIHPLFMIGFSGIFVSAFNLLPIFRLDGGRACTAALGSRIGALVSAWTLLSMFSLALSGSGLAWTWGAFCLFFQRRPEIPTRDEVTSVNDLRLSAWMLSVALALATLLPFPGNSSM